VDGSGIRKEKVADSKISGYVWTGPQKVAAAIVDSAVSEIDLHVFRIHDLNVNEVAQNLLFAR